MKISQMAVMLVASVMASSAFAGAGDPISFACSNKAFGKFSIVFKNGKAYTNFDYLLDGNHEPYEIVKDEDFDSEDNYELYNHVAKEGKADFYFEPNFNKGGRQLKNGKLGGYILIKAYYRSGLRLPQEQSALCVKR